MAGQVACQYNDIGYAAIKWAAENVEDAKLLYVHGGRGEGVYELYQVGVDQAFADFADKVENVGLIDGEWITEASYNVTIDYIAANGVNFNVVFANNDAQAKGVDQALKEAGAQGIPIISTGGSNEGLEMLKDGMQAANMTAPANIQGIIEFGQLLAVMNGMTWGDPKIPLPVIPIDSNNIDDWILWSDMDAGYAYVESAIGPYVK
jgi:ABC-type sugar transport system substrate-binding protein